MAFWILLPCLLLAACDSFSHTPEEKSAHPNRIGRLNILEDGIAMPLPTLSETDTNVSMEITSPSDTPNNFPAPTEMKPLELNLK